MGRRGLALAMLVALVAGGMSTTVDLDVWHQMALARETVRERRVPVEDRFAYTPTVSPSIHHEWGMGMLLYGVARPGGMPALLLLRLLLVTVTCLLAWRLAVRRGADEAVLVFLGPLAIVMSWIGWTLIRAQVVTLLFVAILLTCLDVDRRGVRRWIVPWLAGFVLWVNCHGGFVVGLAIVALDVLERMARGERPWHLVAVGAGMAALILVNPYGAAFVPHLLGALRMDRSLIVEWLPLWQLGVPTMVAVALPALVAVYAVAKVGPRRALGWPLLIAAAYQAVRHQRHVSLFALVWFTQVPALVAVTPLGTLIRRFYVRIPTAVWLAPALLAVTFAVRNEPWRGRVPGGAGRSIVFPVGPVEYLRAAGFTGTMMTPFTAGAYVSWKLHPRIDVSIDSRYEAAYPPDALRDHIAFYDGTPRWRAVLHGVAGTDLVLIPRDRPVAPLMRAEPGWAPVYQDDAWLLFARAGVPFDPADRRNEVIEGTFP